MIKCNYCEAENPEDSLFCKECGNKIEAIYENQVEENKGADQNSVRLCPLCHTENPIDSVFCKECGKRLDDEVEHVIAEEVTFTIDEGESLIETENEKSIFVPEPNEYMSDDTKEVVLSDDLPDKVTEIELKSSSASEEIISIDENSSSNITTEINGGIETESCEDEIEEDVETLEVEEPGVNEEEYFVSNPVIEIESKSKDIIAKKSEEKVVVIPKDEATESNISSISEHHEKELKEKKTKEKISAATIIIILLLSVIVLLLIVILTFVIPRKGQEQNTANDTIEESITEVFDEEIVSQKENTSVEKETEKFDYLGDEYIHEKEIDNSVKIEEQEFEEDERADSTSSYDDGITKYGPEYLDLETLFIGDYIKDAAQFYIDMMEEIEPERYVDINDIIWGDGINKTNPYYRIKINGVRNQQDLSRIIQQEFFSEKATNDIMMNKSFFEWEGKLYVTGACNNKTEKVKHYDLYVLKDTPNSFTICGYSDELAGKKKYCTTKCTFNGNNYIFDDPSLAKTIDSDTELNFVKVADVSEKTLYTNCCVEIEKIKKGVRINSNMVNIRNKPSMNGDSIAKAMEGEFYDVYGREGDWLEISYFGKTAYIKDEYTEAVVNGEIELSEDFGKFR